MPRTYIPRPFSGTIIVNPALVAHAAIAGPNATITLAGIDITRHVDEASINIVDALGQGAGTGGGGAGRAKTASFLTDLGPLSQAVGAGTIVSTPTLVRQGEIQVSDANGVLIFGGFAVNYQDVTERTTILTLVNAVDYWQHLDRIVVNELYDGQTDIFMVKDLLKKYAPWLSQRVLPGPASFTFQTKNYRHFTLQQALIDICAVTGYQIWIDATKQIHYESPTAATKAPFGLSDSPDFHSTFPCVVTDHTLDDTAAINRVYFYGGKSSSGDITQDISIQAVNGNKIFTLAYYPHPASDGKIHVAINGTDVVLGTAFGPAATNTLKSAGGTCDVLLDSSSSTLTFDVAHDGATVTAKYRYQIPLVVVLTDEPSHQFFGTYLDGVIVDSSIFDKQQAIERCKVLLLEQHKGLETVNVSTWTAGIRAGQIVTLNHGIRKIINQQFMCQQVTVVPLGGGSFRYDVQLGSWDFNFVDVILAAARSATPQDTTQNDVTVQLDVQQNSMAASASMTKNTITKTPGVFYVRGTALLDGHDAFCGFCSITS